METSIKRLFEIIPPSELARQLSVSPAAVSRWRRIGLVPPGYCAEIQRITHGQITALSLRPDIFDINKVLHETKRNS